MTLWKTLQTVLCASMSCTLAWGQTPAALTAPAPAPPPCAAAENRLFDFWIGSWNVTNPAGKQAGTSEITLEMGNCVIHEHWKAQRGYVGESFNIYDAKRKVWHQTWVDNGGNTLMLDGQFEGGNMTLSDKDTPGKADRNAINEIIWTANADGSVRQLWRTSTDGGKTWQTAFDGKYVKLPK